MRVYIERTREHKTVEAHNVSQLLSILKLSSEEVLVVRNGTLVPEDSELQPGDTIEILSVMSGG